MIYTIVHVLNVIFINNLNLLSWKCTNPLHIFSPECWLIFALKFSKMNKWIPFIIAVSFVICTSGCSVRKDYDINWQQCSSGTYQSDSMTIGRLSNKESFIIGMTEDQVVDLLDKPTETLLLNRAEKFFLYNLSCDNSQNKNENLRIRFNAIGLVRECLVVNANN